MDSHAYPGYIIPPFYDSLMSKLIVWGQDGTKPFIACSGLLMNTPLLVSIPLYHFIKEYLLTHFFNKGKSHTDFIEKYMTQCRQYSAMKIESSLSGSVAQWWSKRLIIAWLLVRIQSEPNLFPVLNTRSLTS